MADSKLTQKSKNKSKPVVHISGPLGSEGILVALDLRDVFGDKLIIKEMLDLTNEFIDFHYNKKKWSVFNKQAFQKYIDDYISKQSKVIIFIGQNFTPWHKDHYYDLHADYKYYIEMEGDELVTQNCTNIFSRTNMNLDMYDMIKNNKKFVDDLKKEVDRNCDIKKLKDENKKAIQQHGKIGYKIMPLYNIFCDLKGILFKVFPKKKIGKRIILITGIPGSGKSTLGRKIKETFKNFVVVDTDDIDDSTFLELYENKKFRNMVLNQNGDPRKLHNKLVMKKRDEIIKNNKDKTVVFVGITVPFEDIVHEGYFLDTDINSVFKRINNRNLDDICKNLKEIKKLYNEKESEDVIGLMSLYKYKIRVPFPMEKYRIKIYRDENITHAANNNYKIMKADEILKDIKE